VLACWNPNEKEVILFGKRFWPIIEKTQFDYDYEQLTAAWFTFNDIWFAAMKAPQPHTAQSLHHSDPRMHLGSNFSHGDPKGGLVSLNSASVFAG
jgi:hypothetical protein